MKLVFDFLKSKGASTAVLAELADFVNQTDQRITNLAMGIVVLETALTHKQLMTEADWKALRPILQAKFNAPPEEKKEPMCGHMTPVPLSECKHAPEAGS